MRRRILVGDLQGCLEPLERLLSVVGFRPGVDRLLPTGDLVNKGPDSLGVLRRLIELDAEPVLGNHDLEWLRRDRIPDVGLRDWLAAQPIVRVFDDLVIVHAGLHPHWDDARLERPFETEEDIAFATNVRFCTADGDRPDADWPPPSDPYRPWDSSYLGRRRVAFGHWARRGLDVTRRVVALDSGCVYGRELSAWIPEEGRVVQVPGSRLS